MFVPSERTRQQFKYKSGLGSFGHLGGHDPGEVESLDVDHEVIESKPFVIGQLSPIFF